MPKLIGTAPNQVPTNGSLGNMAFQNKEAVSVDTLVNGPGAVGTPSYTFTGDLNTGMWSPAADTIAFSEGGVEAMRINSSANVGIGTTNPVTRLHVAGTGSGPTLRLENQTASTGKTYEIISGDSGPLRFQDITAGVERMRIASDGNVGIGTSSPTFLLQVNGTGYFNSNVQFFPQDGFRFTSASAVSAMRFGSAFTGESTAEWAYNRAGAFAALSIGATGSALTEIMRAQSNGNVGIGISSPSYRLDVGGTVVGNTAGNSISISRLSGGAGGNTVSLQTTLNRISNGTDWQTTALRVQAQVDLSPFGYIDFLNGSTAAMTFGRATSEFMRITDTGNVGIGTNNPGYPLTVQASSGSGAVRLVGRSADSVSTLEFINNTQATTQGFIQSNGNNLLFATSTSERMRINASGNVGIGTSTPGVRLDVIGNAIFGRGGGTFQGITLTNNDNSAVTENVSYIDTRNNLGTADGHMFFGHQTDGGSYITWATTAPGDRAVDRRAERMRINASGNVGIGTTNPTGRLGVAVTGSRTIGTAWDASSVLVGSPGQFSGNLGFSFDTTNGGTIESAAPGVAAYPVRLVGSDVRFLTALTERMRIDGSGRVGIGTSSPVQLFQVTTSGQSIDGAYFSSSTGPWMRFIPNSSPGAYNGLVSAGTNAFIFSNGSPNAGTLTIAPWADGSSGVVINASGEVYIAGTADQGAFNLQVNGTGVWGAGAYVNGSDRNLKEEVAPLADALDVVAALKPVTFRYKKDYSKDQSIQPGFIAQELQEVLADQVYADGVVHAGPKHLNVAYQSLIPVLVKALQEANEKIDTLATRVAQLEGN
jgi:hypothetical protein